MDNKESIIKDIAKLLYPERWNYAGSWEDWNDIPRETAIEVLTKFYHFINEWSPVREPPKKSGKYLIIHKVDTGIGIKRELVTEGEYFAEDIAWSHRDIVAYQLLPSTTHPYEQLLTSLRANQNKEQ